MFEKFFGKPKTPEECEKKIAKIIRRELSQEVNGPAIYNAFRAAKEENDSQNYGLLNNRILNMVKSAALEMSSVMEDALYGGPENTTANILAEIEQIRKSLSSEEKRS